MKKANAAMIICTAVMLIIMTGTIAHCIMARTIDIKSSVVLAVNTMSYSMAYSAYLNKRAEQWL